MLFDIFSKKLIQVSSTCDKIKISIFHLNNLAAVVFAVRAVPIVVGNGFERRVETPHVSRVLALLAEQLLVLGIPEKILIRFEMLS